MTAEKLPSELFLMCCNYGFRLNPAFSFIFKADKQLNKIFRTAPKDMLLKRENFEDAEVDKGDTLNSKSLEILTLRDSHTYRKSASLENC